MHCVVPVWHGFVGVHDAPVVQALHVPPPHTMSVPQVVPSVTFVALSLHSGSPEEQSVVPSWHGFAGVQAVPCAHGAHAPV